MNYANPDMVGHTGILKAAVTAAEAVDTCLGQVVEAVKNKGGELLITGDHGNLEEMVDQKNGSVVTAHTSNKVPFVYVTFRDAKLRPDGRLADIAPTMLDILNLNKPQEMTGQSLIVTDN